MNQKRKSEVDKILQLQKKISQLSDDELKAKTEEFRKKPVKDIKLEAFAVVKEAAKRVIGLDAFPVLQFREETESGHPALSILR